MSAPTVLDRDLLAKVFSLFGSDQDGEVVAAARTADRIVRSAGLSWREVLAPPPSTPAPDLVRTDEADVRFCWTQWRWLNDSEKSFITPLVFRVAKRIGPLTPSERTTLRPIVDRLRAKAEAA